MNAVVQPVLGFLAPGGGEMIVVMLALLLLFGPKEAPRILRKLLDALRKIQRTAVDFKGQILAGDLQQAATPRTQDTTVYDAERTVPKPDGTAPTKQPGPEDSRP